jgi:hypothetical protein
VQGSDDLPRPHRRDTASTAGKLLVVEMVIAPGNEPDFGKFLDLHMLAMAGGREAYRS